MDALARHLAPLARRLRNLVTRATVGLVDDAKQMQEVQVTATADEVLDGCEHWQGYGLRVHPHPGAEALMLSGGGTRAMPLILAVADRRYQIAALQEGEVALYDDLGQFIVLGRSGITITGNVTLVGDLTLQGTLTQTGDTTQTGNLTVTGQATVTSTLAAGGLTTAGAAGGTLAVDGGANFSGTVEGATLKMGGLTLGTSGTANVRAA